MHSLVKPPVFVTAEGRCALRSARKSFCHVCAFQVDCWYLAQDAGPARAPRATAGIPLAIGSPGSGDASTSFPSSGSMRKSTAE